MSAQNHNPFGTGPATRDALILIRGGGGEMEGGRAKGGGSKEVVHEMKIKQQLGVVNSNVKFV